MSQIKTAKSETADENVADPIDRRKLMVGGAAGIAGLASTILAAPGSLSAQTKAPARPFKRSDITDAARKLATSPYKPPYSSALSTAPKLTYDEYRDIRFNPKRAIWRKERSNTHLQLFATGYLANSPVDISIVEKGTTRLLKANRRDFSLGPLVATKDEHAPHALSGFRFHGPINRDDYFDEYAVFQGASYFRAVARDQCYGLSARGLALNTAQPEGEEFPVFRSFWIEKPRNAADNVIVHALLDSPSVTGAYTFNIRPGFETTMEVSATLFPRRTLAHTGIAPLTSMYLFGPASKRIKNDFRPSVHDSEGLAIFNGRKERLWRPLRNPKTLQASVFEDNNPKGFGLLQRDRDFKSYQDLEADYERRPSLWVEPMRGWGRGHVELIEIPSNEEIHDNIVAFWKPNEPLRPGQAHKFSYRLRWTGSGPTTDATAIISKTRVGIGGKPGTTRFVIDVTGPKLDGLENLPTPKLTATHAQLLGKVVVQKNKHVNGLRASFDLATSGVEFADLRLDLLAGDRRISESWLYRWTKS